jgi:RNA polymerase sigma-70 factor (ECF subfamily)
MPEEIARLYDRYAAGLYRYALVVLADHGLAEDAVQQVFSRLLSAKGTRPLMMPDRYLRRAIRNECVTLLRRGDVRQAERSGDRPLLERADGVEAVDHVERLSLEAALLELSVDQREVIALKVYEGLTFKEIAELTDVPLNTVASRYRYAIDKMRTALEVKVK